MCSSETVVGRRALSLARRSESGEEPDGGPTEGSSAICSEEFKLLLPCSVCMVCTLPRGGLEMAGGLFHYSHVPRHQISVGNSAGISEHWQSALNALKCLKSALIAY